MNSSYNAEKCIASRWKSESAISRIILHQHHGKVSNVTGRVAKVPCN